VPTIIGLARAFDLITVAEGVETREQFEFLARIGCDQSQGYLHARPMPAADLEVLLAEPAKTATAEAPRSSEEMHVLRYRAKADG
jgi:EAL domain-containing protein (putative c-di-GMP-specific phosphodiesterase class I)